MDILGFLNLGMVNPLFFQYVWVVPSVLSTSSYFTPSFKSESDLDPRCAVLHPQRVSARQPLDAAESEQVGGRLVPTGQASGGGKSPGSRGSLYEVR